MTAISPPPLSLYVHMPWCVRKCPYCDFNSHTAGPETQRARYLAALERDLKAEAANPAGRPLISVFIGGGTPSLFTAAEIGRLLDAVSKHFSLADDIEITLEANPGTVECGEPHGYRAAGVNRLSIGAQSFRPDMLAVLGRIHSVEDIHRSVAAAQAAGFDNINIDVMYALPGQSVGQAVEDLECAIELEPTHLSWYQLTLEPNTVFHARPPNGMPDDDACFDIQLAGQELLDQRGFEQYEVSAYARAGRHCRHNVNYWSFGDYLAVGAGAHGKITADGEVRRYAKPANPLAYMEAQESGTATPGLRALGDAERVFEFMLNALRLTNGFDTRLFEERTGLALDTVDEQFAALREKQLIDDVGNGFWRVTGLGKRFLNDVQAEFLP